MKHLLHWLKGETGCTVVLADGKTVLDGWALSVLYFDQLVVVEWVDSDLPTEFQLDKIRSILVAPR